MLQEQAKTDCHIIMYFGSHFLQSCLPKMNWMNRLRVKFGTLAEVFTEQEVGWSLKEMCDSRLMDSSLLLQNRVVKAV